MTGKHVKDGEVAAGGVVLVVRAYQCISVMLCCGRSCFVDGVVCSRKFDLHCMSLAGRFKDNKNYLDRFYKPDTFAGLELIKGACDKHGVTMTQATFSWMLCHSGMSAPDGLLLGASKIEHLDQNLACCAAAAPLHSDILDAFDGAWALTKGDAFAYWRSYSADHPGREHLDQGGEYAVKK